VHCVRCQSPEPRGQARRHVSLWLPGLRWRRRATPASRVCPSVCQRRRDVRARGPESEMPTPTSIFGGSFFLVRVPLLSAVVVPGLIISSGPARSNVARPCRGRSSGGAPTSCACAAGRGVPPGGEELPAEPTHHHPLPAGGRAGSRRRRGPRTQRGRAWPGRNGTGGSCVLPPRPALHAKREPMLAPVDHRTRLADGDGPDGGPPHPSSGSGVHAARSRCASRVLSLDWAVFGSG